jgi:peptide/nickel transport system substrate-binding protein
MALVMGAFGSYAAAASATGPTSITLSEGVQAQPNWWFPNDPANYCTTENAQFEYVAYRPLLWIGRNDTVDYGQSIATGITITHDDTVFTVHLGTRYKWSNGQTVNAYDALWNAELLLATSHPSADWLQCGDNIGGMPYDWKSVSAPNSRTLVITTTKPVNPIWFELNGISQIYPVPKSVWDHSANWIAEEKWLLKVGVNPAAPQFRVVDGPYMYGPFAENSYSTLIANPHYTGPDPAHIKKITLLYETSEANLWAAALRGVIDQISIPSQYTSQRQVLAQAGYTVSVAPYGFCTDFALPNLSPKDPAHNLLSLLYVRQAMDMAIDQPAMIQLAGGIGVPDYGPVPPVPKNVFYAPSLAKAAYRFNPQAGKRLLEAHGWRMKNGVMTNAKGQTLTFNLVYASGSEWVANAMQLWQQDLKREGIEVNLSSEPFNQVVSLPASKWELMYYGGGWCFSPNFYPTGAGLYATGSASNGGDFSNKHLDQLIAATHEAGTRAQIIARMNAYQLFVAKILPAFFLPVVGSYNATKSWLHTPVNSYSPQQPFWAYNLWYTTPR